MKPKKSQKKVGKIKFKKYSAVGKKAEKDTMASNDPFFARKVFLKKPAVIQIIDSLKKEIECIVNSSKNKKIRDEKMLELFVDCSAAFGSFLTLFSMIITRFPNNKNHETQKPKNKKLR